ncbi:MAG: family 43 glycosylhydrolase [Spirochaetales bacterium]|nr:family 43 glycosylhydrolase [Spirochaetales bacterium]
MYRNPIISGFNPDPSICYVDGHYYIVTSTFEYFPGVTIWESTDLVNWSYCDSVLKTPETLDLDKSPDSLGLYAATIRHHDGRFYVVTTNKYLKFNFVVSSESIHGPWTAPAFIWKTGIDPSLFFTEDGRCFYTSNGETDPYTKARGIFGAFIDPSSGKMLEEFRPIAESCGGHSTEAPHIYFRGGYYYLIIAEGGTGMGHHVCALRSRDIHGPYEKCPYNPILSHAERKGHEIQCTGHADLLELSDGRWIAVFLGTRRNTTVPATTLGRESFLAPVTWTEDGWPIIGNDGKIEIEMEDILPVRQKEQNTLFVDFGKNLSDFPLLKVRAPKNDCYILHNNAKKLILVGEEDINTPLGHPSLLTLRQNSFNCTFKATLDIITLEGTAGIAAWLRTDYHYRLGITKKGGKLSCALTRHVHDFEAKTAELELDANGASSVTLTMVIRPESYSFHVNGTPVDTCSYAGLTTSCVLGNCFTGTLLGIYAEHGKATFLNGITLEKN